MLDFPTASQFFTCPKVKPVPFRQVDRITEDTDQKTLAKHILIDHIIRLTVIRKHQRHGAYNRHTGLCPFQCCRINIGHQRITQLHIIPVHFLFFLWEIERLMQRIPTIDLHPWQEEAEMKTLQFLVLIDIHHVARSIEKTAHTQVQLVEQSRTPSPVITAGGSAPMLRSRPPGSIMMPRTESSVFTHHLIHLLRQKNLVQVMHLFIGVSVIILEIRMFVYRTCRVHLETVYTIIHKVLQMIHPVLLPGKRLHHRLRQRILLRNAQIILDTEPKPHVIPHPMQTADKQPMVFFLRIASRIPISFSRKLLIVPFLFSREIITFLHPLRFEPE